MSLAVCTIARGRSVHLANMMQALAAQSRLPDLFVIGVMQEQAYNGLPTMPFPVRQVLVPGGDAPLAAARNACAAEAQDVGAQTLVFLDVDCVAAPDMIEAFDATVEDGRCVMGHTRYLGGEDDAAGADFADLWQGAVDHPARRFAPEDGSATVKLADWGEFWSLAFAMRTADFSATGGFDTQFVGYGGEDTDFARAMGRAGLELHWAEGARAVHQWHPVQVPPLGHLDHIVRNANLFYDKHGGWCMEYWIDQLVEAGYVEWGERLTILRRPSADECKAALGDGDVRFS